MKKFKTKKGIFDEFNPLLIAEIAQSHEGSEGLAHSLIDSLVDINCKAVKFQIHLSEFESSNQDEFRVNFSYEDKNRFEYWQRIEFSFAQWQRIINHCKEKDLLVGASVFSLEALDIAIKNNVDFIKVGSGDLLFSDLIEAIIKTKLPVICSSGMATWEELENICNQFNFHIENDIFSILHCTSEYPTDPQNIGFNNVRLISEKLNVNSGLSDHSGNYLTALYAIAKGCSIIELHVNFHKKMFGPDSSSSLTIKEFRDVILALDYFKNLHIDTDKNLKEKSLKETKRKFARSIGIKKNMQKGEILEQSNIIWRKPGGFLNKESLIKIIGKKANKDLDKFDLISLEDWD